MDESRFNKESDADQKMQEFNYAPRVEKDGPRVTHYSVNKTMIAFYRVSKIVTTTEFIMGTVHKV